MNKNFVAILLIFLIPIAIYWTLTRDRGITSLPTIAFDGPQIIKFSSPMCYECQELEKIFEEVFPHYTNKVTLRLVDVTSRDKETKNLINKYKVNLVPTCVFINQDGHVTRRTEGMIKPKVLEDYIKEQLNG